MARAIAKSSQNLPPLLRLWRARLELAPTWATYRLNFADKIAVSPILQDSELYHFLQQAISGLRWGTIALLLVLTFLEPKVGRIGLANWQLILTFAAYNLASELFLSRLVGPKTLTARVLFDLPVAGFIYFCSAHPGSPQNVLIFLAVICAAISMNLR